MSRNACIVGAGQRSNHGGAFAIHSAMSGSFASAQVIVGSSARSDR
jgi:hypothetical protein